MKRILSLLIIQFCLVALYGQAPMCSPQMAKKMQKSALIKIIRKNSARHPLINAHRGCQAYGPENSIPAFIAAGERHVWAIETDFRLTKDGVVVCHHDATLDRTTTGTGNVKDYTYEELRRMRIKEVNCANIYNKAYDYAGFSEAELRIPTMDEYFDICRRYGCVPFIELKEDGGVIKKMIESIKRHGLEGSCVVSSIHLDLLVAAREQGCMEMVHHIFSTPSKDFDTLKRLGNVSVSLNVSQKNFSKPISNKFDYNGYHPKDYKDAIRMCHKMGFRACYRAADTPEAVRQVMRYDVDCFPSNCMWAARMKEK